MGCHGAADCNVDCFGMLPCSMTCEYTGHCGLVCPLGNCTIYCVGSFCEINQCPSGCTIFCDPGSECAVNCDDPMGCTIHYI
jgi:hypothetical protein